ncbi:hypothetical protein L9F63_027275, partial [Diploptera punctata]
MAFSKCKNPEYGCCVIDVWHGLNGGTTVAGTVIVANTVGIKVFATGGLGGVHRGGETTMDISADLTELGRNSIAVVSSGVKSILDIEKTLEYLETQGVCVITYGKSKEFPSFYTQGIPIPEEHAMEGDAITKAIAAAVKEAERQGIRGKEVTPFILNSVMNLTGGKSLESNIALIKNNAKIGAQVACELEKIKNTFLQSRPCGLYGKPSEDGLDLSTDVLVFLDDFSILDGADIDIQVLKTKVDLFCGIINN